jgi:periplasmic protein TonB
MKRSLAIEYGITELRHLSERNAMIALGLALVFHVIMLGGYFGLTALLGEEPERKIVIILDPTKLGPPPSLINTTALPAVSVASSSTKVSKGIPVPVPESEINADATIPTQEDYTRNAGPDPGFDAAGNDNVVFQPGVIIDENEPPPIFRAVEKQPVPITTMMPVYPEIARRAGVEGTVWITMWVTKEGKVKTVGVQKTDAEILNQAAIDAALQWVFTPAVMNNGPVAVWVSIPFRFKLNQMK